MKRQQILTSVLVLGLLLALVAGLSLAQGPEPPVASPERSRGVTIPYPGRLDDEAGQPVADGDYDFTFALYEAESGGEPLWSEVQEGVAVREGTFVASLGSINPIPKEALDGDAGWLAVGVRGPGESDFAALTPRQRLSAVEPAAPSSPTNGMTCPHDHFGENWVGSATYGLRIDNTSTSSFADGLRVSSAGDDGVQVQSAGDDGVYVQSAGDDGVRVDSAGEDGVDVGSTVAHGVRVESAGGDGVHVASADGYGVYAHTSDSVAMRATSDNDTAVWGVSDGGYAGVHGNNTTGYGVYGYSESNCGGYFYGENARGVYASSDGWHYAGYFVNRAGSVQAGLYVDGSFFATGSKSGYVVDIAINEGPEPLETGDVVIITGFDEPVAGEIPVVRIRKATEAESTAVAGVVDQPFVIESPQAEGEKPIPKPAGAAAYIADSTAVGPGEYLSVVTLGSFKAIKVDASYGAIRPGDLLVSSPNPGYAMRAENPQVGTLVGKAMDALDEGTGVIPVLVTLH